VRIPLIVRYPRRARPGSTDALVELHDLTPTILELAVADPMRTCEGRSLVSLLEQPSVVPDGWRDCVFSELKGEHMIRIERYKYTYRRGEARHELFDLVDDPDESRNRSGDLALEDVERELRDRLLAWLIATNRPTNSRDLQPAILDAYLTGEIRPLLV
jgi:arylsulfatase A-like enzyme